MPSLKVVMPEDELESVIEPRGWKCPWENWLNASCTVAGSLRS